MNPMNDYDLQLEPWIGHAPLPVMDTRTAHLVMQKHIRCLITNCRIKHQARLRLIEAGKLVPADFPHVGS